MVKPIFPPIQVEEMSNKHKRDLWQERLDHLEIEVSRTSFGGYPVYEPEVIKAMNIEIQGLHEALEKLDG